MNHSLLVSGLLQMLKLDIGRKVSAVFSRVKRRQLMTRMLIDIMMMIICLLMVVVALDSVKSDVS